MTLQDISLPVDIPWKLIATSNDMLAKHGNIFPNAMWKSSLAVFAFDPDLADLPETFPDRELTFLKVVCSITSYSPCIHMPPRPQPQAEFDPRVEQWERQVEELKKLIQMTFPCSGALVQVAIYPRKGDTTDVSKLAYFAAFEPKKRELIEVVSESGESITQSKSNVNLRKGVTSTDTMEDRNIFTGANVGVGYAGATAEVGIRGEWGTIQKSGTEQVDTTTHDASREARESSSHTTSLSQLYHLLNSYHLGTNRAIFFLQPRPHTVQQKDRFTFIAGPQEIEGIQEFFLVVSRPKGLKLEDYCVDALLYTAHLDPDATRFAIMEPKIIETPWFELWAASNQPQKTVGWSEGDALLAGVAIMFGVPPEAVLGAQAIAANEFKKHPSDELMKLFNQDTPPQGVQPLIPRQLTVLDQYFGFGDPRLNLKGWRGPGWRVDRTRGLGGYDLWEDPDNVTATPLGDPTKTKPQAFVEILSDGNPDDLVNYHPDSRLHVRAFVWPPSGGGNAMYHGRIKVYFIRDDSPTKDRSVRMFVTARGVSTCGDSPFADLYKELDVGTEEKPDVVAEAVINPPNVAPWRSAAVPSLAANNPQQGDEVTPPPINSATPSGYDHVAVGVARAKMANSMADLVRSKLKACLACTPSGDIKQTHDLMYFQETDFVYQQVAGAVMASEISKLSPRIRTEKDLTSYVASHPAGAPIVGVMRSVMQKRRVAPLRPAPARPPAASRKFPSLTLASSTLSKPDRATLQKAGISSGLDLIAMPAEDLALRLGVDKRSAREIRLRAIGLGTGK